MAQDWAADVKKYVPDADDSIIAGIVRYCGIALQKVDSSLVAFSDPTELDRVKKNFLKKKLGLDHSDEALDAAIAKVGERMKGDRTKNRVTVYYLLAEHYDLLSTFAKKSSAKAAASPKADAKPGLAAGAAAAGAAGVASLASIGGKAAGAANDVVSDVADTAKAAVGKATSLAGEAVGGVTAAAGGAAGAVSGAAESALDAAGKLGAGVTGAVGAGVAGAAGLAAGAAKGLTGAFDGDDDDKSGSGSSRWLWWLLLAALILFVLWWLFFRGQSADDAAKGAVAGATTEASAAAVSSGSVAGSGDLASAPAEGSVAIPTGEGVTVETRDGKPVVKVYFASGQKTVPAQFAATAGGLKTYLESHSGVSLGVSGFADSTGNVAANAAVSKRRAEAVKAALIAGGVGEAAIALVKPADVNAGDGAAARRVEVTIQ